MTKTTNSTYIMKKIYLFLLATILPALSINAAVHTIFAETNKLGDNHYVRYNGGNSATDTYNIGDFVVFSTSTAINNVIFTNGNGTSYSWKSDQKTVSNDFTCFYPGSDRYENFGSYQLKPVLAGSWDGNTNNKSQYIDFEYVSGTTYRTSVKKMPSSGEVFFNFVLLEPNNNNIEKMRKGFQGYWFTTTATSTTYANNSTGENKVVLSAGMLYHFELDFSNMKLTLVLDAPENVYLYDSSNWGDTPGMSTQFKKDSTGKIFTLSNVFMPAGRHFKVSSGMSNWNDVNLCAYGVNEDDKDYSLDRQLNELAVSPCKPGAFLTTVSGMYTIKIDFTSITSPKLTVTWAASNLSLTPTVDNISYTTADIKYSLTTSNVPTSGVTYSVKCSNYPAQTSTSGTFNLTGLESNKDQTFTVEAVAMYSGVTIASDKKTVTFKTLEEPKTAVEDVIIDAKGYDFEGGEVSSENEAAYYIVTLSSQTAGANIYYTLDGSDPDDKSIAYSVQPFMVPNSCKVRAVAYVGQNTSNVSEKDLNVINSSEHYTWDNVAEKGQRVETVIVDTEIGGLTVSNTKVLTLNLKLPEGCEGEYIWTKYEDYSNYAEGGTWADQNGWVDHLTGDEEHDSKPFVLDNNHTNSHDCRNFENAYYRCYFQLAPAAVQGKSKVASASKIDPSQTRIAFSVLMESNATGIDEITVDTINTDDSEAPVVYYNLQGVRVVNPSHGLYIRVQGATSSKVFIK